MTASDWLILAVALADPKPVKPVQIQKILFLLDRKLAPSQKGVERIYAFSPYDYGPFDSSIYFDAERLAGDGFLTIENPMGQTYKQYKITEAGKSRARQVAGSLDVGVMNFAQKLVEWCQSLSFNQLVSAVYREYPDMKENSVFRG